MPYKDPEKQREAVNKSLVKYREKNRVKLATKAKEYQERKKDEAEKLIDGLNELANNYQAKNQENLALQKKILEAVVYIGDVWSILNSGEQSDKEKLDLLKKLTKPHIKFSETKKSE